LRRTRRAIVARAIEDLKRKELALVAGFAFVGAAILIVLQRMVWPLPVLTGGLGGVRQLLAGAFRMGLRAALLRISDRNRENPMQAVKSLSELREQGKMTWIEGEHGWVAAPAEVLDALTRDGFEACKRELTTSRRDGRPAGGVWQGVNARTGTVASAIWVNRPGWQQAIMFIDIDGESLGDHCVLGL
jgi:hypothetical protein